MEPITKETAIFQNNYMITQDEQQSAGGTQQVRQHHGREMDMCFGLKLFTRDWVVWGWGVVEQVKYRVKSKVLDRLIGK